MNSRRCTALLRAALVTATLLGVVLAAHQAQSQQATGPEVANPVAAAPPATQIGPGDLAVTGFSGTKLAVEGIAPGVEPIEKTVIDTAGASLRIYDASTLGGPPAGQILGAAVKFEIKAQDVGQVFGLAIDDASAPQTLFTAATSAYGLQIVADAADKDGSPVRLKAGAPGAHFMTGQFGSLASAGPGTIYKIDGATGAASVFGSVDSSGAGLSGPAIDAKSRSLYVADLDSGLVHRFSLDTGGASAAQFDHGTAGRPTAGRPSVADDGKRLDVTSAGFKPADPSTWGLSQPERRVTGLAVHDGRLFYATAEGPEIWSVGLNADGSFAGDPRLEMAVTPVKQATVVSILFDAQGQMLVGLRGSTKSPFDFGKFVEPDSGQVLRFAPQAAGAGGGALWMPDAQEYSIGSAAGNGAGSGGVTLGHGYAADGTIDVAQCNATLAATGDTLAEPLSDERVIHGVQLNAVELVRPANTPPTQSAFLDFDGRPGDKEERGHVGAVLAVQSCGAPPPVEGEPPVATGPPIDGGGAGGGGAPGEGAPPAEGAPPSDPGQQQAEEQPPVDPDAPNLAVSKSRSCAQAGDKLDCTFTVKVKNTGTAPFDASGASFDDVMNVPADAPVQVAGTGTGTEATESGFHLTFPPGTIVPPGNETPGLTVKASFAVPKGGMVVENCAAVSLGGNSGSGGGAGTDPNAPDAGAGASAAAAGQPKVTAGPPTCTPNPDDKKDKICKFPLVVDEPPGGNGVDFTATLDIPSTQQNALTNPDAGKDKFFMLSGQAADNKSFDFHGNVDQGTTTGFFEGHFPAGGPDPQLTVTTKNGGTAAPPAPPAGPSVVVNNGGTGQCDPPNPNDPKNQTCHFVVAFKNDGDTQAPITLKLTGPEGGKFETAGSNAGIDPDGTLKGGSLGAHETRLFDVSGTFPVGTTPTIAAQLTGDAAAQAAAAQDAAAAGGDAAAGQDGAPAGDGNPADDVACVKFDTNNPNAPEEQTNEPTLPAPDDQAAPGPGNGGVPPDQAGDAGDQGGAQPPAPPPDIAVSKTGTCTPNGNKADCSFSITLKNNGTEPVTLGNGSLEDKFSGATPTITNPLPGSTPTPTGFTIPFNGATLQPGESSQPIDVKATVDIPPGGAKVQNCATFTPGPSPVPLDDAEVTHGNPTIPANSQQAIVSVAGDPVCTKRGDVKDCLFDVSVRNFGKNPFPLNFKFKTDNPKAKLSAPQGFIDPNQNAAGGGFSTISKNPPDQLASGDEATVTLRVEVPADAAPLTGTLETVPVNALVDKPKTVTSDPKAGTEPTQDAPEFADADPTNNTNVCAPPVDLKRGPPPPKPQARLTIKKTAQGDKCKKTANNSFTCLFDITIKNEGPNDFDDKVVLDEETTNLDATSSMGQGFQCDTTGTKSANCSIDKLSLKAGESKTFTATSLVLRPTLDAAKLPVGGCKLTNGISINSPRSDDAMGQTSTATATLDADVNHGGAVPCDPPGLKLTKTAQGCTPSGDGFECKYHLTVTSTGPDAFQDGTIVIDEKLSGGAKLKNPPPGCGGTQCSFEHVSLDVGATREIDLVTSVPKSAVGKGQCEVKNEASVSIPGSNLSGMAQLTASASAKIDSPECNPTCQGGMTLTKGVCGCPGGQQFNTARKSCVAAPSHTCPAGYSGEYPTCCSSSQRYDSATRSCRQETASCYGGMVLIAMKGTCGCPAGMAYDTRRGGCLGAPPPVCLMGYSGIYPVCCSPDQYYSDGKCYTRTVYQPPEERPHGGTNGSISPPTSTPSSPPERCSDGSLRRRGRACGSAATANPGGGTNFVVPSPPPAVRCANGSLAKSLNACAPPSVMSGGNKGGGPSLVAQPSGSGSMKVAPSSGGGSMKVAPPQPLPVHCPNGFYAKTYAACGGGSTTTNKTFNVNRPGGGGAGGSNLVKSANPGDVKPATGNGFVKSANPVKSFDPKAKPAPIKAIGKYRRPNNRPPMLKQMKQMKQPRPPLKAIGKLKRGNNIIKYRGSGQNNKFRQPN